MVWLREMDPHSITYRSETTQVCDSYVPKRVTRNPTMYCHCGFSKSREGDEACVMCKSNIMKLVKESVENGKLNTALNDMLRNIS